MSSAPQTIAFKDNARRAVHGTCPPTGWVRPATKGELRDRLKQLEINCRWLVEITDRIHDALCPGQYGTWQDRAKQAAETAERMASNVTGEPSREKA